LDDLNTPLSGPKAKRRLTLPISAPQALAGLLGLFLAVFAGWAVMVDQPLGGEPAVLASLPERDAAKPPDAAAAKAAGARTRPDGQPAPAAAAAPPAGGKTVTIIDGTSGRRQEVVIPGLPAQKPGEAGIEPRLLEGTRHGRIPKVAATGPKALEVFASTAGNPPGAAGKPRIAIVVGGLGVSASVTADALSRLPPAVTLAFVPYGANLDDLSARARARGHEVLLQAPMEPFDYPDNDPGPQTLLTTLPSEQNLDRLHWQMSRFQGYVGLMNLMGARFTTSEKALAPVLADIAKRGLLFVDDGSSTRSVAGHLATVSGVPFAKAELVLDTVPTPNEIDRALRRLETVAQKNGIAVATISALPVSIDRVVRWAKGAEGRGYVLVPITVAALKSRSS
jgi:polysaccharide deacetylase 2 family uncharacterized protein YibQ